MYLQANPRVPVLWTTGTRLRCGDEPYSATCVVTDAEAAIVDAARAGTELAALTLIAQDSAISQRRLRRLLAFVRPSLLDSTLLPRGSGAESGELSDATTAPRARALRQRRESHVVQLIGDTRYLHLCDWMLENTGLEIELMPIASSTSARRPVHEQPASDAAPEFDPSPAAQDPPASLHNEHEHVCTRDCTHRKPIGLFVGTPSPHPTSTRNWMRNATPHIAVSVHAHGVEVSPAVLSGVTPCLNCRELWRAENDATWMLTAAQLSVHPVPAIERTVAASAMSLALMQVLALADGEPTPPTGYRIHPYGTTRAETPRFHPACGCREFAGWWSANV